MLVCCESKGDKPCGVMKVKVVFKMADVRSLLSGLAHHDPIRIACNCVEVEQ